MTATDLAAWWGGIVATLILVWDVYKWKKIGPIVNVSVSPNIKSFGEYEDTSDGQLFMVVEVTNTGDRKTTLTHLFEFHYASFLQRLRKKKNKAWLIPSPAFSKPFPYVLEPGEQWIGGIRQNEELEEFSRDGMCQ